MWSIEGSIGVGKTTCCEIIKNSRPALCVKTEPIDKFERITLIDGTKLELLKDMYDKQDSRSFYTLQVTFFPYAL